MEVAEVLGPEPEEVDEEVIGALPICEALAPMPPERAGCLPC